MINKKGSTLTNWTFSIIILLVFLVILQTQVLTPMNNIYNKSLETGLNTSGLDSFESLIGEQHTTLEGAEATQTAEGLTLKDAWTVGKGSYNTIVGFISGNFFHNLMDMMDLPPFLATILTLLVWISLIMIIIYIFMKVVP